MTARINRLATAVPDCDFEKDYRQWALRQLEGRREARLYARMAERSGIDHRWSILSEEDAKLDEGTGFYSAEAPSTAQRMTIYAEEAPTLAMAAIAKLGDIGKITHLVVASCTGFVAPGIDQILARRLGLADDVERVLVGFMGCYAAVTALRTARHIVRSESGARVLVVTVELSTLHHQQTVDIEPLLAGAQFGDGAAAAIISGSGEGLAIEAGIAAALEESDELITWQIGNTGFEMRLSGEVPTRIRSALKREDVRERVIGDGVKPVAYAVHAGGRSILDAVADGLDLDDDALDHSRGVLRDFGNMSSSTLMFVLERTYRDRPESGVALAFGPGLAMEGFRFAWRDA
ncbi:type III polyketide synthase [Altererythrobacter aurantiacus]|uniref:Type III polyketide synthase n=1 Tax=Parapontixanthobacter aurantiacus TaxID=1463599 RepID=A0A844Z8Z4_9SPHN|nr:type III polyketide synthase [Parapontixanthobacter aurantiacus]MXO85061.1 type III polyketide synthase [Parapontixanthobacter aurantiacus]